MVLGEWIGFLFFEDLHSTHAFSIFLRCRFSLMHNIPLITKLGMKKALGPTDHRFLFLGIVYLTGLYARHV